MDRYPSLDKNSNSVSYSFKVSWSDGSENMNKFLIILGRNGYSEFEIVSTYGLEEEFKAAETYHIFFKIILVIILSSSIKITNQGIR